MADSRALTCPQCGSDRLFKSGVRKTNRGPIQRYLCRNCALRFSEGLSKPAKKLKIRRQGGLSQSSSDLAESPVSNRDLAFEKALNNGSLAIGEDVVPHNVTVVGKALNSLCSYSCKHQVGATWQGAKNLETKQEIEGHPRATTETQDVNGKIVQLIFYMQKQGYSPETVRLNRTALKILMERGANLLDSESVKEVISKQKWSEARKRNVINAYSLFLKLNNMQWEKPRCNVTQKFPFMPTEAELDSLISGCGPKTSTFLQLLKETAMRSGEAKRLEWINIDSDRNTITLNDPEKRSNPRMWKVSQKLISMLNNLPKESERVFGQGSLTSMKVTFMKARKRLAAKLQNPRLPRISFHTFRHWKATMLYHETKDPYYVKSFLGHKSLRNTEIYINIERTIFEPSSDEFTVKVAEKPEEIKSFLEVGFEYVCEKDGLIFLRKRK